MVKLAWGQKITPAERQKVIDLCEVLGFDPSFLMADMWFESRLDPAAVNSESGASGIIQFTRDTAFRLGTTVEAIRQMDFSEQLGLVRRYFQPYIGRIRTLEDSYMAILMPTAVGESPDFPLMNKTDLRAKAYFQNKGLDVNQDGIITKAEASSYVIKSLSDGWRFAADVNEGTSTGETTTDQKPTTERKGETMGAAAIFKIFGSVLSGLIPQIAPILKPESEVAKRNLSLAEIIIGKILDTTGAANMQEAIEKMEASQEVKQAVQKAVVTEPAVLSTLQITEVGGGIAGARQTDLVTQQQEKPFYKTSAVFWISIILLPMVVWYVGSSVVGGIDVPQDWPWYAQLPLKLFGVAWSADARAGLANLVVGLVLGGICGVYYGVSVTQQRQQQPPPPTKTE